VSGGVPGGWAEIRRAASDRVSGAAEIALRAAEALAALPRSDLEGAVSALARGHPSMAPLWRLGTEALGAPDHAGAARTFAQRLAAERDRVASRAAGLLFGPTGPGTVVVHSYSGTVVAAVAAAGATALCARSEPGGEGQLTASRLADRGVEAIVVDDDEAAERVAGADALVTGADAVGPGGVVNKAGTARLARAASSGGRPAIVVAGSSKLIAADLPAPHPFERVPLAAFSAIVTEEAVLDPTEADRRVRDFSLDPALAELLATMS
jgi:translation initiation factor 2B subunit (eIF-2B alpha/beta/delta family)